MAGATIHHKPSDLHQKLTHSSGGHKSESKVLVETSTIEDSREVSPFLLYLHFFWLHNSNLCHCICVLPWSVSAFLVGSGPAWCILMILNLFTSSMTLFWNKATFTSLGIRTWTCFGGYHSTHSMVRLGIFNVTDQNHRGKARGWGNVSRVWQNWSQQCNSR